MAATGTGTGPAAARALPAFVRFVVFGGGVTLLGSGALLLVGDRAPVAAANAVVTVVTTLLATELHTRFTFRRGRASWSDHCASGLTVLLSYLFTTGALLGYDAFHTGGGALVRQGVYLAASGAAGVARFLLLRYVFARTRHGQSPTAWGGRVVRAARRAWSAWGAWGAAPLARAVGAFRFAPVSVPLSLPVTVPLRVSARRPVAGPGGGAVAADPVPGRAAPAVRVTAVIPSVRAAARPPVMAAAIAATVPGATPALWAMATASPREPAPNVPSMATT